MSEQEEQKVYEQTEKAEGMIEDLRRELNEKGNSLLEQIDCVIYIAMKLRDELRFIDTNHIKEIVEFYEG